MKILLILPVFAIVLWSFAEPEYKFSLANAGIMGNENASPQEKKEVKGKVLDNEGYALPGTTVVLKGTTQGTKSDSKGFFKLEGVPEDGQLVLSFVGYKSKVVKPVFTSEMTVKMEQDTVKLKSIGVPPPPPPPPPPSTGTKEITVTGYKLGDPPPPPPPVPSTGTKEITVTGYQLGDPPPPPPPPVEEVLEIKSASGNSPLFFVDGKEITQKDIENIDPNSISSISVLKAESSTAVYGEKGKDGVILIVTKSGVFPDKTQGHVYKNIENGQIDNNNTYTVIEEMPSFPGGMDGVKNWIYSNIKMQKGMDYKTVTEPIKVVFTVGGDGKVKNVKVLKAVSPLFDSEAVRVVSSMPDWKPGYQNGKPVPVSMVLPIDFNMKVPVK